MLIGFFIPLLKSMLQKYETSSIPVNILSQKNDQSALAGKTAHSHIFYRLHTCLFKKNVARRKFFAPCGILSDSILKQLLSLFILRKRRKIFRSNIKNGHSARFTFLCQPIHGTCIGNQNTGSKLRIAVQL